MSRIYGFTGPEHVDPAVALPLRLRLAGFPAPQGVVTGAAKGIDTIACRLALDLWPKAHHEIIVPNFRHNEALVEEMKGRGVDVVYMSDNTGPLDRNVAMVDILTHLIAVPLKLTWYRSGTWHTINRARRVKKPVIMLPIDVLIGG